MKTKTYKYERLSESDSSMALAAGIARLSPRNKTYHAANYVLTYQNPSTNNGVTVITVEDKKQSFKCTVVFGPEVQSISVSNKTDGEGSNYPKAKSALRQMLAAIVLHDYSQMVIPKEY